MYFHGCVYICADISMSALAKLQSVIMWTDWTDTSKFNYIAGTPTCHSISYSIPFHLTAVLTLSIPQLPQTDLVNSSLTATANHTLTPSFSVYFHKQENGPQQAYYIHQAAPTSSANQSMAEQTGQHATGIKVAHSDQRDSTCRFKWVVGWEGGESGGDQLGERIETLTCLV